MSYQEILKLSPNYWAGRSQPVREVLVHWMVSYIGGADAQFANPATQVSAHVGVEDDKRHRYVYDENTAWAARQANPWTLNVEFSAAPGRDASEATYANAIDLISGWCRKYAIDPMTGINYHKKYVATSCSELRLDYIRQSVRKVLDGQAVPAVPTNPVQPTPAPVVKDARQLYLPAAATSWRVYPTDKAPVIGNEIGYLNPSLFGGLTYQIVAEPQTGVYTINTRDYGQVNIFGAPSTGASVVGSNNVSAAPQTVVDIYKTVFLPGSATSWRVYPLDKSPVVGNESGRLNPSLFGGLTYEVLGEPQANVVTIQTRDFGKVNVYVGPETGATRRG